MLHAFDQLRPHGLVSKAHGVDQLLRDAIRRVLAGGRFLSPDLEVTYRTFRVSPEAFPKRLTAKQQSLMPYFAHGDSDDKIAQALTMGVHAVRSQRYRIMSNLDLHSTADLARWARRNGFGC